MGERAAVGVERLAGRQDHQVTAALGVGQLHLIAGRERTAGLLFTLVRLV